MDMIYTRQNCTAQINYKKENKNMWIWQNFKHKTKNESIYNILFFKQKINSKILIIV
jgi:hypothetical protein